MFETCWAASGLNGLQERLRSGFLEEEQTGVEAGELDIPWESLVSLEAALGQVKVLVHHLLEAGLCLQILWVAASQTSSNLSLAGGTTLTNLQTYGPMDVALGPGWQDLFLPTWCSLLATLSVASTQTCFWYEGSSCHLELWAVCFPKIFHFSWLPLWWGWSCQSPSIW